MSRIEVTSTVGADGVLRVPLPPAHAGRQVRVTVEDVLGAPVTAEEWRSEVLKFAGAWRGEFERPDQGAYEEREPLS